MTRRGRIWAGLGAAGLALAAAASAMPPRAQDAIATEQARLVAAKRQSAAAAARAADLDRAARAEQDAAAKARAEEAAVAARIDKAASDIDAAEARIALVQAALAARKTALADKEQPVTRLIAALQAMARRPAIVAVAQPGSVDDLVHLRAVLGTVAPAIRARTAALRDDLSRTRALEAQARLAVQSLTDSRAAMDKERLQLARLEARHRARAATIGHAALAESDRAIAMGEAARDIVDKMDEIGDNAATAAALAELPGPTPRPANLGEPGTAAMVDWTAVDAPYRLPVAGKLVTGLGEVSDAGVRARGLTLATASGATVRAPAAGRVAYARAFRDYGTIVVIDHGAGWTTLITGLGAATVRRGDTVAQGAPIGRAATGDAPRVTVELRRGGVPVDMIPLLG